MESEAQQWANELSGFLRLWLQENNYKQHSKFAQEMGIGHNAWQRIISGKNIVTDPEVYARIMRRTGLSEADPRTIPPRIIVTRGKAKPQSRAWTEEQYQDWLKKQTEQSEPSPETEEQVETLDSEVLEQQPTLALEEETIDEETAPEVLRPAEPEEITEAVVSEEEVVSEDEAAEEVVVATPPRRAASRTRTRARTVKNEESEKTPPHIEVQPHIPTLGTLIAPFIDAVISQMGTAIGQHLATQVQPSLEDMLHHLKEIRSDLSEGGVHHTGANPSGGKLNVGQLAEMMVELLDKATQGTFEEREQLTKRFRLQLGRIFSRLYVYTQKSDVREANLPNLKEFTL